MLAMIMNKTLLMTATSLPLLALSGLASYYFTYFMFSVAPQENATRVNNTVLAICDNSIQTNDFTPCRIAQEQSNTEFLCNSSGCWVEKK
jgi:hypothetical protein